MTAELLRRLLPARRRWPFGLALSLSSVRSARSRAELRKIWSRPGRYCGGQWMSVAPYQAAAFRVKDGSTRCGRASATRSARPAATMVLTWSAVVMAPTHIVASPASLRIWSENGVWNMRPIDRLGVGHGLAGRDVDQVAAGLREGARDLDRVVAGEAAVLPVGRRDAHRHRLLVRPGLAHRAEHFEREAQAVLERCRRIRRCACWSAAR